MGIRNFSPFDTHFGLMTKQSADEIIYRKMALFFSSCWFYFANFLFLLFRFIAQRVFRVQKEEFPEAVHKDKDLNQEFDSFREEETSNFSFKFQYQIPEVNSRIEEKEEEVGANTATISNYQFLSEKDFSGFVEEPEAMSFSVLESFIQPKFLLPKDFQQPSLESNKGVVFLKDEILEEANSLGEREVTEGFSGFGSDSESVSFSDGYSVKNLMVDSDSDGFLSERDFGGREGSMDSNSVEIEQKIEGNFVTNCDELLEKPHGLQPIGDVSQLDEIWSENDPSEPDFELKELSAEETEETQLPSLSDLQIEFVNSSDDELASFRNERDTLKQELESEDLDSSTELHTSNSKGVAEEDVKTSEETQTEELDDEDLDELESLWEHQDLIEQLRMELRRVRAVGLPTILEESESPKTIEDLKPWKIDEKFLREDPMDELNKFYRSYRERMRKFDILNYQKMYAIGFLQLKDPLQSLGSQKPLIPSLKSHLSHNFWPFYRRKSSMDPSEKFIKELQTDLETVYVGQTCLSWEFLLWQYEKARDLPDSDRYKNHQYNQVAGEFQQFQVVVQRFIENESFQGPRLPNYVKNRCVLRNLLQVPVIKEDCLKDKMEEGRKGNYAITSEMLEDIMEESISVFWEFVKADKDETPGILKGLVGNHVELQDPSDFDLMLDIQADLQKKEKKLKDILKTGNCLVKKFKKPKEDRSNQDLFFSQVDMKLISRVLKMSRITSDQLVWCYKKLNKITFIDRKIHREPSFLLFPC